jgi:hypothetical protein
MGNRKKEKGRRLQGCGRRHVRKQAKRGSKRINTK